jgi:hypothetical protein
MRDGDGVVAHEWLLLSGEGGLGHGVGVSDHNDGKPPLLDARAHRHLDVEGCDTDLREPEVVLLDQIEAQDVASRRTRCEERDIEHYAPTRGDRLRERGTRPVPHDRIAAQVEPVVAELEPVGAVRPPRRAPAILELDPSDGRDPGKLIVECPRSPARYERIGRLTHAHVEESRATLMP